MAEIIPLKGVRYAPEKVEDLDKVITPPYDIISPGEQERLYSESPFNIIRLEKPRQEPGDDGDERYMRARDQYRWWLERGILRAEEKPVLYLYEQEYGVESGRVTRQGLICGVKLTPYEERVVLPHEETMQKPKEDRLKLMRACRTNFSPIFSLYAAKEDLLPSLLASCKDEQPVIDFEDSEGQSHRVWVVRDEEMIAKTVGHLRDKQIFIADGHHRYETALSYHEELGKPLGLAGYVMMTLVNIYDPGLIVLPTHRMVRGLQDLNLENLLSALRKEFQVEEYAYNAEETCRMGVQILQEAGHDGPSFGLFAGTGKFYLLQMKKSGGKDLLQKLDTEILQEQILDHILGIDAQKRYQGNYLTYSRDCGEAVTEVMLGNYQLSFLLNPTPTEAVTSAAEAGQKMPQKSTYFFPKLVAGLIINPLD